MESSPCPADKVVCRADALPYVTRSTRLVHREDHVVVADACVADDLLALLVLPLVVVEDGPRPEARSRQQPLCVPGGRHRSADGPRAREHLRQPLRRQPHQEPGDT